MIFEIPSVNFPKLEKKLKSIKKKCEKYNCSFKFEKVGEIVKKYEFKSYDSTTGKINIDGYNIRFIQIDVEGTAIINDWEFIAAIDHLPKGNVIRKIKDITVPERFRDIPPLCEHCNTIRPRNNTYIIRNIKSGEFKQVGRSCLKDYTGGLSAEHVGAIESLFHEIRDYTTVGEGCHYEIYEDLNDVLLYSIETIRKFGYHKSRECDGISGDVPTSSRVFTLMNFLLYGGASYSPAEKEALEEMVEEYEFSPGSPEDIEFKDKIKEWVSTLEATNDYYHNLKVIFSSEYVDRKYIGIIASSIPAYKRAHPIVVKNVSEFQGKIGEHHRFEIKSIDCVWTGESYRRMAKIYRILDKNDNVYIWRTTTPIIGNPKYMDGIVKEHSVFRDVKQTVITRCKLF